MSSGVEAALLHARAEQRDVVVGPLHHRPQAPQAAGRATAAAAGSPARWRDETAGRVVPARSALCIRSIVNWPCRTSRHCEALASVHRVRRRRPARCIVQLSGRFAAAPPARLLGRCPGARSARPSSATLRLLALRRRPRRRRPARSARRRARACARLFSTWSAASTTRKSASPAGTIGLSTRGAEAHVAGDRAAALAHAVDLALLHVQPAREGGVGQDVGGLEHALAAEAGDARCW